MEKGRKIAFIDLILVEKGIVEKILVPRSKGIMEDIRKSNVEAVMDDTYIILHSGDDTPVLLGGELYPEENDIPVEFHLHYKDYYNLFTLFYSEEKLKENILELYQLKKRISSFLKKNLSRECTIYLQIR